MFEQPDSSASALLVSCLFEHYLLLGLASAFFFFLIFLLFVYILFRLFISFFFFCFSQFSFQCRFRDLKYDTEMAEFHLKHGNHHEHAKYINQHVEDDHLLARLKSEVSIELLIFFFFFFFFLTFFFFVFKVCETAVCTPNVKARDYYHPEDCAEEMFFIMKAILEDIMPSASKFTVDAPFAAHQAFETSRQRSFLGGEQVIDDLTALIEGRETHDVKMKEEGDGTVAADGNAIVQDQQLQHQQLHQQQQQQNQQEKQREPLFPLSPKAQPQHHIHPQSQSQQETRAHPLLLTGEAGVGKSSVLANLSQHLRQRNHRVFTHYIGCDFESTHALNIIRHLLDFLHEKAGSVDPAVLARRIPGALARVCGKLTGDQRLVIVLDGLHQMQDESLDWLPGRRTALLQWLPITKAPERVRFVFSALPSVQYDSACSKGAVVHVVSPLSFNARADFVSQTMAIASKSLLADQMEKITHNSQTLNPLFLSLMLQELIEFGAYRELNAKIDELCACNSIAQLVRAIVTRLEQLFSGENGCDLTGFLCC